MSQVSAIARFELIQRRENFRLHEPRVEVKRVQ
jgi:hypothetical protein